MGAVPDFDVTFALFSTDGFSCFGFQTWEWLYGVTLIHVKHQLVFNYNDSRKLYLMLVVL